MRFGSITAIVYAACCATTGVMLDSSTAKINRLRQRRIGISEVLTKGKLEDLLFVLIRRVQRIRNTQRERADR